MSKLGNSVYLALFLGSGLLTACNGNGTANQVNPPVGRQSNLQTDKKTTNPSPPSHESISALNDQLLTAVSKGDLQGAMKLVKQGADVNAVAPFSPCFFKSESDAFCSEATPLLLATSRGDLSMAQYLVSQGADPTVNVLIDGNSTFDWQLTPLQLADGYDYSSPGHFAGPEGQQKAQAFMNLYVPAASESVIRQKNVDEPFLCNVGGSGGVSMLDLAAKYGDMTSARLLIKNGANVNGQVTLALNPLEEAAIGHNTGMIELLINAGADVNYSTAGPSAVGIASADADIESTKLLLDHGAKINDCNYDSDTCLFGVVTLTYTTSAAELANRLQLIQTFVARKIAINHQDERGWTALMYSVDEAPNPDIVESLLEAGANPNLKGTDGSTAMKEAQMHLNGQIPGASAQDKALYQKIVDELKAHGATQ